MSVTSPVLLKDKMPANLENGMFKRIIDRVLTGLAYRITRDIDVTAIRRAKGDSFDIETVGHFRAAWESSIFVEERMQNSQVFYDDISLLTHALSLAIPGGLFLEFGVASGRTIKHVANTVHEKVFGFNSFEGLPELWRPGFPGRTFAQEEPSLPANVELVKGLFADSLPKFIESHPSPVSFIHVDCDLYSSTKQIFDLLGPQITSGCVIVFDEYFNFPGWKQHEHKAFEEFLAAKKLVPHYEGFVSNHQQLCVVLRENNHIPIPA